MNSRKIRVLVVDDSALVRSILAKGLSEDPGIDVVGTAGDPYEARDKILALNPDVMTLDVEMPRMDGLEFLRKLMPQHPLPTVMVSAQTERGKKITLDALECGAVDFVNKPKADIERGMQAMMLELRTKVKIASTANLSHWKNRRGTILDRERVHAEMLPAATEKVIAIGASAGGTEAIKDIICRLPTGLPGIVVVQHLPPGFTKLYAERLNSLASLRVKEAAEGDRVIPGTVLIAPGGKQMRVVRSGGGFQVACVDEQSVCGHCPSIEVLFRSVATAAGKNALGVILTGMGHDGAQGLKEMLDQGAVTIAQDEESCIVFGMPKAAIKEGGAQHVLPLGDIATKILQTFTEKKPETKGQ
jgi:two-component system chemotaxis response regulator CheB